MKNEVKRVSVNEIENKIYIIRDTKVILDKDLAILYQVKPKALRQQVKRNKERFPKDFMFQLTRKEAEILVSQNVTPSMQYFGGTMPYAFSEQGVAMLSSVLKSKRAALVNIQIIRTFVKLRELLLTHKDLQKKIEGLERNYDAKFKANDQNIKVIFETLRTILLPPEKTKKFGITPPKKKK
ncbi:ORF6N domain-containing protein [Candidatus Margulisiibacteriota bacterium]